MLSVRADTDSPGLIRENTLLICLGVLWASKLAFQFNPGPSSQVLIWLELILNVV